MSIIPEEEITKSSSSSDFTQPQLKRSAPPWEFSSRRCSSRIAAPDLDESASPSPSSAAAEIHLPNPNQTWLRLCGCSFAVLLMAAMLFLILLFTAFRIRNPAVSLAAISGSLLTNRTSTIFADVKVRNPNAAPFRFVAGETTIYHRETVVGEARTPPGKVKARGTVHLKVAVEILVGKLSSATRSSRPIRLFCITRIPGDVKVITKKHMVVKVNCEVNYDYVTGELAAGDCIQFVIP